MRSSRSESRYSAPVCGLVTLTLPVCSDGIATAAFSCTLSAIVPPDVRLSNVCPYSELNSTIRLCLPVGKGRKRSGGHRGDLLGNPVELGEKLIPHLVAGRPGRVGRQVDGADSLAAAIAYRHSE